MNLDQGLCAGVARRDLAMPPPGLFGLGGMPRKTKTAGAIQPIRVEALSLACGDGVSFLLCCDILFMRHSWAGEIRRQVASHIGCDPLRIVISCTHCHSALPDPYMRPAPNESAEKQDARRSFDDGLVRSCVQACVEAHAAMQPAEIAYGRAAMTDPICECRRTLLSNGAAITSWGLGPVALPGVKLVEKADAIDADMDVLCLRRLGADHPFAVLVTLGSHIHLLPVPYAGGEVAGAIKQELEARKPSITALYATHTAGNVSMKTPATVPVTGREADELAWHRDTAQAYACRAVDAISMAMAAMAYRRPNALHHLSHSAGDPVTAWETAEHTIVHALVMGDCALVNIKPEMFSCYGMELRARSPFKDLVITGYNESTKFYVGSSLNYEQGSYEIKGLVPRTPTERAAFERLGIQVNITSPELGQTTVDRVIALLDQIKATMSGQACQ